jgi:hypothetical protein
MQQIGRDWKTEDTVSLIVDVPAEHLDSLDLNPPWDLLYLFLILKGTFVAKFFPCNIFLILWSTTPLPLLRVSW